MMSYTNNNTMNRTHILYAKHVQEMIWVWHSVNLGWLFKDFPAAVIVLVLYRRVFLIKTWNELRVLQNCLSFCSFSNNYQTLSSSCLVREINRINRKGNTNFRTHKQRYVQKQLFFCHLLFDKKILMPIRIIL